MNKRNILFLFVLSAIIVALGVARYILTRVPDNPAGTVGNTPGNLYNLGMVCEYDGKVYFHNYNDKGTLYRMNPNETEVKKVIDESVAYINAAGNYLYYYQNHDNNEGADLSFLSRNLGIYRSTLAGKGTVCLQKAPVTSVVLIDNDVFYQYFDDIYALTLYKKHIDNSKEIQLTNEPVYPVCAANSTIYYAGQKNDHNLYAYDIKTDTSRKLFDCNISNPVVSGGYVYYMNNEENFTLCRRSLNGGDEEVLTDDRVDCFNVVNNTWIYYQKNSRTEPALKRMSLDGGNNEIIMYGNFTEINSSSMYVYFRPFDNDTTVYHQLVNAPANPQLFSPVVSTR